MLPPHNVRGRVLLATMIGGLLISGALYASISPDTNPLVGLNFGSSEGFTAQGPEDSASQALQIVLEMRDGYVESLSAYEEFKTFNGNFGTQLGAVTAQFDADQPKSTTVSVGDVRLEAAALLEPVPDVDFEATLEELYAEGWALLPPGGVTPPDQPGTDPDDPGEPTPDDGSLFRLGHGDDTYAVLWLQEEPAAAELIILETAGFGGLHVIAHPWFVEHRDQDGQILDLWVRNPFQTVAYGPLDTGVTLHNVHCDGGQCIAKKEVRGICKDLRPHCEGNGSISISHNQEGGHVDALPGTLLHAWSYDALIGGAGISILESHEAALAGDVWQGDPFGEGMWVSDDKGLVASVRIQLPTAAHPGLEVELGGPVVDALHGESVMADADLSAYEFQVNWGSIDLSSAGLYALLDPATAAIVGTWTDTDENIRALQVSGLQNGQPIASMVSDGSGDVIVSLGPASASLTSEGVRIEGFPDAPTGVANDLTTPATTAIARLANLATDEVEAELRLLQSAAGCDDNRGCLAIVFDATEGLLPAVPGDVVAVPSAPAVPAVPDAPATPGSPEAPHAPPLNDPEVPDLELAGVNVPDVSALAIWLNQEAGTALAVVPDLEGCAAAGATTLDACLAGTPDVVAAASGLIARAGGMIGIVPDPDDDLLRVVEGDGNELVQVREGRIQAAGAGATWGNSDLMRVFAPDGTDLCVRHTFDPTDATRWPSLTLACGGLGGDTFTVQPSASYEVTPTGRLQSMRVVDPTDGGEDVFYFYDDGDTTTLYSTRAPEQTMRVPSTLVRVVGNPLTSPNFQILLAGQNANGNGAYTELEVARQAYAAAQASQSALPAGSEIALVFDMVEAPQASFQVDDGQNGVMDFSGNKWTSGQRDHVLTATTQQEDMADRVDLVYNVGEAPTYGASPRIQLSLVGTNDDASERTYQGTIPASALSSFQDGAQLHFALAWTQAAGPTAFTRWDDNGGQHYRYLLDNTAPAATMTAPSSTEEAVFMVTWTALQDMASGLSTFNVQTQTGQALSEDGWSTWIDGRSAGAPRHAEFTGTPDARHWFRAQACDNAGNCGAWTTPAAVSVLAAAVEDTTVPALTIHTPADGAALSDIAILRWSVVDDGGPATTNVHQRASGTNTWASIYSGDDGEAAWDTNRLRDGIYELRFTATDGRHEDVQVRSVTLANGNIAPNLDAVRGALSDTQKVQGDPSQSPPVDGRQDAKKDAPAASLALVVLALVSALVLARRRTRGNA